MTDIWSDKHQLYLSMNQHVTGGLVNSPAFAEKLAKLFLEEGGDVEDFRRQLPLKITDCGDHWNIRGSWNTDLKLPGLGPWEMTISKRDAQVLSIFHMRSIVPGDHSDETEL